MTTKKEIMENVENVEKSKIVANNTVEYYCKDGRKVIRLHFTDIIIYHPDGSCELQSGGWKTVTTKARMNEFSPFSIYQKNHEWYVVTPQNEYDYFDGIRINPDGSLHNPAESLQKGEDLKSRNRELIKKINQFCKEIEKLETLPEPQNGDCWFCLFKDKDGKSLGDMGNNTSHLESHLDENYIHGSLLVNAILSTGYRQNQLWFVWNNRDIVTRSVKKYFKRQFSIS